jgi:hypothetical protein
MAPPGSESQKAISNHDLESARLMLVHAAGKGMDLPKDMVLTLSNAIEGASSYDGRAVQPVDFWLQFTTLAKMLAPVTPESLRCCADSPNGLSPAKAAARRYNRWGYAVLLLLFFAQAYWFVLISTLDHVKAYQDIVRRYEQWHEVTRSALRESLGREPTDQEIAKEKDKVYWASADITSSSDAVGANARGPKALLNTGDINYVVAAQKAALDAVANTAGWASWLMYPKYLEQGDTFFFNIRSKNLRDLQAGRFLLDLLSRYVLPILYGLAGASLYVVRSLESEIRRSVYTRNANVGLNLRLFLGGAAGLAAAWLVLPPSAGSLQLTDQLPTIASLTPLVLSFLAGYAVEILFSLIDRVIAALTAATPKPA